MKERLLQLAYRLYTLRWWLTRPFVVGVRLLLVQDEQVLLVRHSYQPYWFLPGGRVDKGESALAAAVREAKEEAGVTPLAEPRLLGVYTNFVEFKNDHVILFVCDDFTVGTATDRWEIADVGFFPLDALPSDASPATVRRVADFRRGPGPFTGAW